MVTSLDDNATFVIVLCWFFYFFFSLSSADFLFVHSYQPRLRSDHSIAEAGVSLIKVSVGAKVQGGR